MNSVKTINNLAQYLPHYLNVGGILVMFATATAAVLLCVAILRSVGQRVNDNKASTVADQELPERIQVYLKHYTIRSLIERYFELMFSGTIYLLFTSFYFMMSYFGVGGTLYDKYGSYILLVLVLVAVAFNDWLDKMLIPLETLRPGERETIHFIALLYMLVIFAYIKFVYVNDNYDSIIQYFILMFMGKFIGFDSSIGGTKAKFKAIGKNLILLFMALGCTGLMALVGFGTGYLLRVNGVVWNLFLAQLFLVIIMYIVHKILNWSWKKIRRESRHRDTSELFEE